MTRRRTKKEKQNARHPFLVSWNSGTTNASQNTPVKRQLDSKPIKLHQPGNEAKKADLLDKDNDIVSIKKGITKSLALASLILGMELVLYLAWHV